MATTNSCSLELPENQFVHCTTCEDFDLCQPCFARDIHGHHPKHGFVPAVPGTLMPDHITVKMAPGRNQMHHAICDGCDKVVSPSTRFAPLIYPLTLPSTSPVFATSASTAPTGTIAQTASAARTLCTRATASLPSTSHCPTSRHARLFSRYIWASAVMDLFAR